MQKREARPEELAVLEQYFISPSEAFVLTFDTDEELFKQGEKIPWFIHVLKGSADVQINAPNGTKLAFGYTITSGPIGDVELTAASNVSYTTVVATSPVTCVAIPFECMLSEIERNIDLCRLMGKKVAYSLAALQQSYMLNIVASGEQRLCSYILRKSRQGVFRETLSEASSVIGVSYRHVFRMMAKLCEDGVLCKCADGYHTLDPDELINRATV